MDGLSITLLILAIAFAFLAAWLLFDRSKHLATTHVAKAREEALAAESARTAESHAREIRERDERLARLEADLASRQRDAESLRIDLAKLGEQFDAAREQHELALRQQTELAREREEALALRKAEGERVLTQRLAELNEKFEHTFKSLAAGALQEANKEFVRLADASFKQQQQTGAGELDKKREAFDRLIKPLTETLQRTDLTLAEMEKARTAAYSTLVEQVRALHQGSEQLRGETGKLVRALREPNVRGRYGEVQLKRVAELAGMTAYCDFDLQSHTRAGDGDGFKPDMLVRLPGGRVIVVDAKTNIQGYLDALHADSPDERDAHLDRYAKHVAEQVIALAKKNYTAAFEGSPAFTVMFIPGDQFIDAALSRKPEILEEAARRHVILASPSMLIGLLRAVYMGFQEQNLANEARQLRDLGSKLHEQAAKVVEHLAGLGKAINQAAGKFNDLVGSYEHRLEPTLRKFEEAGVKGAKDLPEIEIVSTRTRPFRELPTPTAPTTTSPTTSSPPNDTPLLPM